MIKISRTGRCRTLPAAGAQRKRLKLGLLTCQDYTNGYYGALAQVARDDSIDYVLHLGDFVYESVGDTSFQRADGARGIVFDDMDGGAPDRASTADWLQRLRCLRDELDDLLWGHDRMRELLDQPATMLDVFVMSKAVNGKTLRELVVDGGGGLVSSVELIGTPDQVAERMGEVMAEVGGDGFLITTPVLRVSRRYLAEVADGLVPALQKRGLARTQYKHELLRDNLREF